MRAAVLGLIACVHSVLALSLQKRDVPAVLELPLQRRAGPPPLQKRSSVVNVEIVNQAYMYYSLNLSLGTPEQHFQFSLDTGSSDLWVNVANSSECSAKGDPCAAYGVYNASASSTYEALDTSFNITYADGTNAYGPYAADKLVIGDTTIEKMQFAIAEQSTDDQGILGVGYEISTYQAEHDGKTYPNFPQALVNSGAIKSAAYSLYLNALNASSGSILFGGVNKAKYTGELKTVPIVPVYDNYYSLAIALTEVSVEKAGSKTTSFTTDLPLAVSLDCGSVFTALPEKLVDPIYKVLDAAYDSSDGVAYIDCSAAEKDYNITYSFSGATVTVGISQLVLPIAEPDFSKGSCIFGLVPSEPGVNLMGDTFLRSAYVVYDMGNNEISLANANFAPGDDDDILEIGTGTAAVPGATLVPSAVSSATGNGVAATTVSAVTITGTVEPTETSDSGSSGSSGSATSASSKGMGVIPTAHPGLLPALAGVVFLAL